MKFMTLYVFFDILRLHHFDSLKVIKFIVKYLVKCLYKLGNSTFLAFLKLSEGQTKDVPQNLLRLLEAGILLWKTIK